MRTGVEQTRGLEREGIRSDRVKWNLSTAALYEEAIRKQEGLIAAEGPLACRTGQHTGRSPNDKFVVREPSSEKDIAWGKVNRPMDPAQFDVLHRDIVDSLDGQELYVQDCYAGADPAYRLPIRVINEYAWHSLFARNLFIVDHATVIQAPQFTIIDSPRFQADPKRHGTSSAAVIALNFARKLVLIGGTSYAGEMKKSIFSVLNYLLPLQNVLGEHRPLGRRGVVLRPVGHGKDDAVERPGPEPDWRR
jgi:phosphoenolpyruvate carboxykinase (ATP)